MEPCLSCIYLTYCMERVKIFIMNRYILKSYATSKVTIDRQYTERVSLEPRALIAHVTAGSAELIFSCYLSFLRISPASNP